MGQTTYGLFTAAEFCADLGGGLFGRGQIWRLPMVLELRSAHANGDINITAAEWSQSYYFDDANGAQAAAVDGLGTEDHNTIEVLPFRCAAIPLQRDLFFIPLDEPQDGSDAGAPNGSGATEYAENGAAAD
jgi:hypothetical protein